MRRGKESEWIVNGYCLLLLLSCVQTDTQIHCRRTDEHRTSFSPLLPLFCVHFHCVSIYSRGRKRMMHTLLHHFLSLSLFLALFLPFLLSLPRIDYRVVFQCCCCCCCFVVDNDDHDNDDRYHSLLSSRSR